ncbi:MAG: DUF3592 domain-containing protein [Rhodocyclaceae bacterium]|nr:DUF3592 domain-containing protein [Rhodocyclaceae bacterium]MBP6108329.1 DUF3592 domain-containing protein [Rhodocyclaceae bacterium]MBP6278345.1 DUF3592 domain-containing protein [Rhodocyclaceae bacterium]
MPDIQERFRLKLAWWVVLPWLICAALSALGSWAYLLKTWEEHNFRRDGKTTEAQVISCTDKRSRKSHYYCDYRFSLTDSNTGNTVNYFGDGEMIDRNYSRAKAGESVVVVYDPSVPSENRPREYEPYMQFGGALILAAFSLWLFWYLCRDLLRYWEYQEESSEPIDWSSIFWFDPDAPPEETQNPYGY